MKRYLKITVVLLLLLLISSVCFGANKSDTKMVLVKDESNVMTFGSHGEFEKKLIQIDTDKKTIDFELKVRNTAEAAKNKSAEIVLLIDSSRSMSTNTVFVNEEEMSRKDLVLDSAQKLIDKLLASNEDIKIGIVEFATSADVSQEGTSADAKIITEELTNDPTELSNALNTIADDQMGARTDVEIGLETAEQLLGTSENDNVNKYVVVLTDAVPNSAKGVISDLYTEESADPTKDKLLDLSNKGINIISLLIDISENDINISGRPEGATFKTYKDVATYVFGSSLNPTAGSVYYVDDDEVEDTITKNIYDELLPEDDFVLRDISIKDFLPKNIVDNFDFEYLKQPSIGSVSDTINSSDNSLTWTISELKPGEESSLIYRITLKDTFPDDIVGKNLPTTEKVTIGYTENGETKTVQDNKSPVVALDIPAKVTIPQTGSNQVIIASLITLSVVIATSSFIAVKKGKIK